MKHLIKNTLTVLTALSLLVFTSCKEKDPETTNPCDNAITVTATEIGMYHIGHFSGGGYSYGTSIIASQTYYFVRNWNDYSQKVIPGRQYKIGFKEVDCGTCQMGCFGDSTGKYIPRCGMPILKCIELLCLEEVNTDDCFSSYVINPDSSIETYYSRAIESAEITGNVLKTKSYFSGCSASDNVTFALNLYPLPTANPGPYPTLVAKVVEVDRGFTCQAVFTKNTCFNLNAVKEYFMLLNMTMPDKVIIKFQHGDKEQDFEYSLK